MLIYELRSLKTYVQCVPLGRFCQWNRVSKRRFSVYWNLFPIQYTARLVPQLVYGSRSEYLLNVNRLPHSGQRYDRRGIPRDQSATSTARPGTLPHRPKAHGSFVRELTVAFFIWLCLKFITILRNTFSANYIIWGRTDWLLNGF